MVCGLQFWKTLSQFLFGWYSCRFREITYAKRDMYCSGFFGQKIFLFLWTMKSEKQTKEVATKLSFSHMLFIENKAKISPKKMGQCFFTCQKIAKFEQNISDPKGLYRLPFNCQNTCFWLLLFFFRFIRPFDNLGYNKRNLTDCFWSDLAFIMCRVCRVFVFQFNKFWKTVVIIGIPACVTGVCIYQGWEVIEQDIT